jgi:hypothetical protein
VPILLIDYKLNPLVSQGFCVRESVAVGTRHVPDKATICVHGIDLSTSLNWLRIVHRRELSMSTTLCVTSFSRPMPMPVRGRGEFAYMFVDVD